MASDRRIERLQSFIIREVTSIFQKGMNDPRIGEVLVTRVTLSKDLKYCTVYVVLNGTDTENRTSFRGLESATATVQYRLASVLSLRNVPILKFEIDSHPEKAQEMDDIFKKIAVERDASDVEEEA